jgi:hypothetical protein
MVAGETPPMTEKKDKKEPQSTVVIRQDDGPSSRTDRALEYQFDRSSIKQRLAASEEFRVKAVNILGDRFVARPEIKMLIETMYTDLRSSYGAGIAEREPMGLRNLNADEWFLLEFARCRRACTIYNVTRHNIRAWNYDHKEGEDIMKEFKPGEIMRHGEDNPWAIEIGMTVLRLLHHNPFRSIPALEGRPQITLFKEEMVEKKPSWDTEDKNSKPAPRTPTP